MCGRIGLSRSAGCLPRAECGDFTPVPISRILFGGIRVDGQLNVGLHISVTERSSIRTRYEFLGVVSHPAQLQKIKRAAYEAAAHRSDEDC